MRYGIDTSSNQAPNSKPQLFMKARINPKGKFTDNTLFCFIIQGI
jgi:hypothetical protein